MDKDDFVGKSALEGRDQRSLLAGMTCQSETPAAGSDILDGHHIEGHITAGVPSPTLGCGIGYARFNHPGDWSGRTLELRLPDGAAHPGDIVDVPFFDHDKAIVRGADRTIP